MARRVLADFDAEVLKRIGNRTDITSSQRGFFLRDGYLAVCKAYDHEELQGDSTETGTSGLDYLALSNITDMWWPYSIKDATNGLLLRPEDRDTIDNYTKVSSKPQTFYWYRRRWVFDCNLDANISFQIKYKIQPAMFTVSPAIGEIYDPLIVLKAAQIAQETNRAYEEAGALRALYKAYESERGLEPVKAEELNDYMTGIRVRMR